MNLAISENLQRLLFKISQNNLFPEALKISKEKYNIFGTNIDFLSPQKVLQTYTTIKKKQVFTQIRFYYQRKNPTNCSWFENQLRIFIWVLVCYLYTNDKQISNMNQSDWEFFVPIFYNRDPILFQFQSILLVKNKSSKWTEEQIELLDKIVKIKSLRNKWNAIARQLYVVSNKQYIKTPKQCRERWLNYLDPSKVHSPWLISEDLILLKSIKQNGKRWAYTVKKLLKKRTQHMVKNRFNSLINIQKKRIGEGKSQHQLLGSAIQFIKKQKQLNLLQTQKEQFVKIQEKQIEQNQNSQYLEDQQIKKKKKKSNIIVKSSSNIKKKKKSKQQEQEYYPKQILAAKRVDSLKTQCNLESSKNIQVGGIAGKQQKLKFQVKTQGKFPQFFMEDNSSLNFNPFEQEDQQMSLQNHYLNGEISQSQISLCSSENINISLNKQKWTNFVDMQQQEDVFLSQK